MCQWNLFGLYTEIFINMQKISNFGLYTLQENSENNQSVKLFGGFELSKFERKITFHWIILSHCKTLVKLVNNNAQHESPSWQAASDLARCIRLFQQMQGRTEIRYISREGLAVPHKLANKARKNDLAPQEMRREPDTST